MSGGTIGPPALAFRSWRPGARKRCRHGHPGFVESASSTPVIAIESAQVYFFPVGFGGFLEAQRAFISSESRFRPAAVSPRFLGAALGAASAARFAAQRRRWPSLLRFLATVALLPPGGLPRLFAGATLLAPPISRRAARARSIASFCSSRSLMMLARSLANLAPLSETTFEYDCI
jgi:hypothetical protein